MEINVIDSIRTQCINVENEGGQDAKFELKVSQVKALLNTLSDQEREILGLERVYESLRDKVNSLVTSLDCYNFEEFSPSEDFDNEIFEVFIGTLSDNGRVFAIWDAESGAFHEPPQEGCALLYHDDVVFWRYSLPEPHEAVDLGSEI